MGCNLEKSQLIALGEEAYPDENSMQRVEEDAMVKMS